MKKPLLITLGLVLIIIGAWSLFAQDPINTEAVESHVRENIASLSPRGEVLGGIFFVTNITVNADGTGVVEYEDGHNGFTADFVFSEKRGAVVIESFVVRE